MLVLLESLSPEQRAVLLLHDVFDYRYPEIAATVGKSEDNVRQLATRARRHVEQRRPRFQTTREQRDELARRFFAAAERGDLAGLEALLAHDGELTGDGGGKVPALARSLRGRNRVARTLTNWLRLATRVPGVLRPVEVNGGPGALYLDGQQRLIGVLALDIADGQGHERQRDRQPRQADASQASGRPQIATEGGKMNSGAQARRPVQPFGPRSRRHSSSHPQGSQAAPPAGALPRQMYANQGQDPTRSTARPLFRSPPNVHIGPEEEPSVNRPGNEQQGDVQTLV